MIKTLIKTDNSFLTVQPYSSIELLEDCVKDVESKLLVKPKIYIYGKEATQHRNIGFFSDESIGYRYSNQLAKSQALTQVLKKLLDEVNEFYFDPNSKTNWKPPFEASLEYWVDIAEQVPEGDVNVDDFGVEVKKIIDILQSE